MKDEQGRQPGPPPVRLVPVEALVVDQHAERDHRLHRQDDDHAHHRHQAVELDIGLGVGVVAAGEDGEQPDDDGSHDRLGDRRDVRALPPGVGPAERPRRQALAADGVQVARGGVVEGHAAGERAGDDQVAHHRCHPVPGVVAGRGEEVLGRVALRLGDRRLGGGISGQRGPGRDRVEDTEPDHRDVHGARDVPLGIAGLLAVVRRHLEADPGPEGEEQADADRARRQLALRREPA